MHVDFMSDLIARINFAVVARLESVHLPMRTVFMPTVRALQSENYLAKDNAVRFNTSERDLFVPIVYLNNGAPAIVKITQLSSPSRRIYSGYKEFYRYLPRGAQGCIVISTSFGVMSHSQARRYRLGGEVLLNVR